MSVPTTLRVPFLAKENPPAWPTMGALSMLTTETSHNAHAHARAQARRVAIIILKIDPNHLDPRGLVPCFLHYFLKPTLSMITVKLTAVT